MYADRIDGGIEVHLYPRSEGSVEQHLRQRCARRATRRLIAVGVIHQGLAASCLAVQMHDRQTGVGKRLADPQRCERGNPLRLNQEASAVRCESAVPFEQINLAANSCECDGSSQAGGAGTDHGDALRRPRHRPQLVAQVCAAVTAVTASSDATHAQIFQFEILVHAVARPFAAESRLLDPAERCDFVGDQPGINADHAVLEPLGHAPNPADIA